VSNAFAWRPDQVGQDAIFHGVVFARKPELKPRMAQMARINNNLETKIASKSEASAINEARLSSVKSVKSAVLISEVGLKIMPLEIQNERHRPTCKN